MSPGRLLYLAYHQPREWLETRADQLLADRRDARMRRAAFALPPGTAPDDRAPLPPVRFLTGLRFAHQSAFCARSLELAAGHGFRFEFFDDGSLAPAQSAGLLRLFPGARVVPAAESLAAVDHLLPASRFPALRFAREKSPLMRKLLDLRAASAGPSLYLDSDMLFFHPPAALLAWLRAPAGELHMAEANGSAYVDTPETLERLFGRALPRGVNSGILALDDSSLDWPALERSAAALGETRLAHKWAEQTLFAHLLARPSARPLDPAAYRVCNSRADLGGTPPVLRHYVHKSKAPYVAGEWLRFASSR